MIVKNNYNECLTNFACSIRKYFDLQYSHNTLDYIDKILEEYQPRNVVTILCDGMGSLILDKMLDKDNFLIKNRLKTITSVFPATTVAATTSVTTGLNPYETGMLGWDMYYKEIDKTISVFRHALKEDPEHKPREDAMEYNHCHMKTKTIMDEINDSTKHHGYTLYGFGADPYRDIDDMFNRIIVDCRNEGKNYVYAYDEDPDHTMHIIGSDKSEIKAIIEDISRRIEALSRELTDTIIFVIADHGHRNIENLFIKDYPDIEECLLRNTSLEPRAVNFFIKPDKKEMFVSLFNKYFGDYFDLYPMDEVIESKLFGDGVENEIFRDSLGDYLAIAKADKALIYTGGEVLVSHHAGYTDEEIMVPIIMVKTRKK